jgi:hypothetical protein
VSGPLDERAEAALIDLCGCPGLHAGQYEDLHLLPLGYVDRRYGGLGGFMGLAKAYPTLIAIAHCARVQGPSNEGGDRG